MSGKIAINLLSISPKSSTGSFVYIKNLLDSLFALDTDSLYFLIIDNASRTYFIKRFKNYPNVKYHAVSIRRDLLLNPVRALLKLWAKIKKDRRRREAIIKGEVQRFLDKKRINLMFFPSGTMYPAGLKNIKTVTTVFDLQHEYFPNNFSNAYLARRRTDTAYASHNSDRIIAIYLAPQQEKDSRPSLSGLPANFIFYPAAIWHHKNHRILIEATKVLKS